MFKQIFLKRKHPIVNDYYEAVRKKARQIEFSSVIKDNPFGNASEEQYIQLCLKGIRFGLSEAGEKLLFAIFVKRIQNETLIDIITKLKEFLATEQDSFGSASIAAYVLGRIYAGEIIEGGSLFPHVKVADSDREFYAIMYARYATSCGNDNARRFLSTAFSTGKRGCIHASFEKWLSLNETLSSSGCQSASLELGCYSLGVLPNGKKLTTLQNNLIGIQIPHSEEKGRLFLLKAMKGSNIEIATLAIERFCETCDDAPQFAKIFKQEASCGNQIIALYLAYAFCPEEFKPSLSIELTPPFSFTRLFPEENSLELSEFYLRLALNGPDTNISQIAATFLCLFQKPSYPSISS